MQTVNQHMTDIDALVDKGMQALAARPQTVDEIGQVPPHRSPFLKPHLTLLSVFS